MMESNTEEGNLLFTDEYKKALENASYEIVGNHSAVEICGWTKKGLNEETSGCYKQKFYGIRSHQCTQMTHVFQGYLVRNLHRRPDRQ